MLDKKSTLERAIETLGTRISDLGLFAAKVRAGLSAGAAIQDILLRAIVEIRKYGLAQEFTAFGGADAKTKRDWSTSQFWYIVKLLADGRTEVWMGIVFHPSYFKSLGYEGLLRHHQELASVQGR